MTYPVNAKGFARLDFDEIKRVAAMTGFDIYVHARKKRSCGPGCDYLVQDKRYYTLLLIKHIETMLQKQPEDVPQEVLDWLATARIAAREYADIERTIHRLPGQEKHNKTFRVRQSHVGIGHKSVKVSCRYFKDRGTGCIARQWKAFGESID